MKRGKKKWMRRLIVLVGLLALGVVVGVVWGNYKYRSAGGDAVEEQLVVVAKPDLTATPAPRVLTIAAVGDVMLGRTVREQMIKRGDWSWPFRLTGKILENADITVGNLEAPIVENCTQHENRMVFCMNPEALEGLTLAGFDVFTLANNHMLNYGSQGLGETRNFLKEAEMKGTYNGELVIREVKDTTIGFMGYDDVSRPLDLNLIRAQTASAAAKTDFLVVMVHWGNEYTASPSGRQQEVAQHLAAGGVSVILGSHPHWVQNVEKWGETLIFWSLGNFVFDQMWSEETRQGSMAEVKLSMSDDNIKAIDYKLLPVRIFEYGQPRLINLEETK